MKTPALFDVPKDAPTRKERMKAFKIANDIETHYCQSWEDDWHPWLACKMDLAREIREPYRNSESNSLGAIMADVCRLVEESGVIAEGKTERDAIIQLCGNLDIVCSL